MWFGSLTVQGFVRHFGELILPREYVLSNSFNQSRFDVCTGWAAENSGQGISFGLREIVVTSALKLMLFHVSAARC